jgi:hypothetical protein
MQNTKSIDYLLRSGSECSKTLGFPRSCALHFNNIWPSAPLLSMARQCAMLGRDFSTSVAGGTQQIWSLGSDGGKDPQAFRDIFDNLGAHRCR